MKIALLTFQDTNNFGSVLQTYGLYQAIKDLGEECEILDYQCPSLIKRERNNDYGFHQKKSLKSFLLHLYETPIRKIKYRNLRKFLEAHAKLSHKYYPETIKSADSQYDSFLIGSDIVWGWDIIDGDTTFFLSFVADKSKKIAFSPSVGNPWPPEVKEIIKPLLNDFRYIATRENDASIWVSELTNTEVPVVCDPTTLITADRWRQYLSNKINYGKRYVLVYFMTEQSLKMAKKISEEKNIECWVIANGPGVGRWYKSIHPTSVEEFLELIDKAEYVLTGSYHGLLFSLYFNRPFLFYNRAHKSRMNTLASYYGIVDRDGTSADVDIDRKIDWNYINHRLEEYRNYSMRCLNDSLKGF